MFHQLKFKHHVKDKEVLSELSLKGLDYGPMYLIIYACNDKLHLVFVFLFKEKQFV